MPNNLKGFFEEQKEKFTTEKKDAQKQFAQAQTTLSKAQKAHGDLTRDFSNLEKKIADAKKAIAAAHMPADIEASAQEWRDLIIQQWATRNQLLDAEEALEIAKKDLDLKRFRHDRAAQQLSMAEQQLQKEEKRETLISEWQEKLNQEPLKTLQNEAKTALDDIDTGEAMDRLKNDIPQELLDHTLERGGKLFDRLKTTRTAATSARHNLNEYRQRKIKGLSIEIAISWENFLDAEAAFRDYVLSSKKRFNLALRCLDDIDKSSGLTDAESDRIHFVGVKEEIKNKAKTALEKEKARDAAWEALKQKKAELVNKTHEILKEDIDADVDTDPDVGKLKEELTKLTEELIEADKTLGTSKLKARVDAEQEVEDKKAELEIKKREIKAADPTADDNAVENHPEVKALKKELSDLESALQKAIAEYNESPLGHLHNWRVSIPEHIWANLAAFVQAKEILTELQNTDPADLKQNLNKTEDALVRDLKKESERSRILAYLQDRAEKKRSFLEFKENVLDQLLLRALRGVCMLSEEGSHADNS